MERKELLTLMKTVFQSEKSAPTAYSCIVEGKTQNFSAQELNDLLCEEFKQYTHEDGKFSITKYNKNKWDLFSLITTTIEEVIPPRVEQQYMQFAEVQRIEQGNRATFRLKVTEASKRRFKAMTVTRGALAGRYETYMLDGAEMEIQTGALVGAAKIGFEEVLDGRWSFSEFTTLMMEAFDEAIQREVVKALAAMVTALPPANKATFAGFDEKTMDELLNIVDTYGKATIYCTQEFANQMIPSEARMSNGMKDTLWNTGWLGDYKGHNVIIMPQSIDWEDTEDGINSKKAIDPSLAYIIPTGSEKPVKIVFEGSTHMREVPTHANDDWSTDVQVYMKVGVGTIAALGGNVWTAVYKNTELGMDTRTVEESKWQD